MASLNPFRYRGYYFDTETGLYYLNSRYYDPEIGRFINADDIGVLDLTNITINGLNLYAYCLNNPVNEVDESGHILPWLIGLGIAMLVMALANTAVQLGSDLVNLATTGQWISGWEEYVGAFVGGLIGGAVFFATRNIGLSFGSMGAIQSLLTETLTNFSGRTNLSFDNLLINSATSFGFNYFIGALGGKSIKMLTAGRNNYLAIFKSGLTKLSNDVVSKMSTKVIFKGIIGLTALKNFGLGKGAMESITSWIKYIFGDKSEIGY